MRFAILSTHDIKNALVSCLTPDLLEPKYRALVTADDPPESGHCAVATEAFYHLAGGKSAGFIPVVCRYDVDASTGSLIFSSSKENDGLRRETHWWTRGPAGAARGMGDIVDVTSGQYAHAFPYEKGHNTGFMQPQQKPSKRAQILIDRVTQLLGAKALEGFKIRNIRAYQKAQLHSTAAKQPQKRKAFKP